MGTIVMPAHGKTSHSAWGLQEAGRPRLAPGSPGARGLWSPASKDGVGTALGASGPAKSLVWFTLCRGAVTEVFYPSVDRPCTRELRLIVTSGPSFFSDETKDADHETACPIEGVPLYRMINTCRRGRYGIEKEVFTHPERNALLQHIRFVAIEGELSRYRLFAFLNPHVANLDAAHSGWLGEHSGTPMLCAERPVSYLALASSSLWRDASAGFVGVSDGLEDIAKHGHLTQHYDRAERGNVALIGEVDLVTCRGDFLLSLGFGRSTEEAAEQALAGLRDDFDKVRRAYVRGWQEWQAKLTPAPCPRKGGPDRTRASTMVLRTHADKTHLGAMVASLAVPWGEVRGNDNPKGAGGYHLVWPRDLCETAGGLLAVGAPAEAAEVFRFLQATQKPDGHWPQNMWVDGEAYWQGLQLGETAISILLLDHLLREGAIDTDEVARLWPMVRKAVSYIVVSGPSTQQDRWENQAGYTPFTLAIVIAALLVAADLAEHRGDSNIAPYLRETADAWYQSIDRWLYVTNTDLAHKVGVDGYYARIIPSEVEDGGDAAATTGDSAVKATRDKADRPAEVVSPDALALVRFGLRAPDDPRIVNTVKAIDAILKVETPFGPSWHRYNGDGYGERADGTPFDGHTRGIGRAWPLLTGERAHYELAAGRRDEAIRLLAAMSAFANETGLISEQVWDTDDIPEKLLFFGRPTGSANPLVWAHAEYLKLCKSIHENLVFACPPQPAQRYLKDRVTSHKVLWRFDHHRRSIEPGQELRIETLARAVVRWTTDDWATHHDTATRDSMLGTHYADLPTGKLQQGVEVAFTFQWPEANHWEGRNFAVAVVRERSARTESEARRPKGRSE